MSGSNSAKLVARNVAAIRRFSPEARVSEVIAGNPAASRLESGVGNCFPGLECDLRNLERRFFPFMEVEALEAQVGSLLLVASVDADEVTKAQARGDIVAQDAATYEALADDLAAGRLVLVSRISGTFGLLGQQAFDLALLEMDGEPPVPGDLQGTSTGQGRRPADAWTAVRLLTEGTDVTLTFRRAGTAQRPSITAKRARYLDDNGALSAAFLPGELTQSLCSPWTHDFRDCGCYYWASNHPDIAQPVLPGPSVSHPSWNLDVPWQRRARAIGTSPPPAATPSSARTVELDHYEINNRWQELHFVVGRREIVAPYSPSAADEAQPLPGLTELLAFLRYAAGVELAAAQEYLCAAYSLKPADDPSVAANGQLREDIGAARAEIMRIAIGEMRHTRAVNDIVRGLTDANAFTPALHIATKLPAAGGQMRASQLRPATHAAIDDFIALEAPSAGVDGLYGRILATLITPPQDIAAVTKDEWREAVRSIIAEGEDHFQTFRDIKEWLGRHAEPDYLGVVAPQRPPAGDPDNAAFQAAYAQMMLDLRNGYRRGRLEGAAEINAARTSMLASLDPLANAVASKGFLLVFEQPVGPEFAAVDPPAGLA